MATDNVFITDESYYGPRGGFDVEDVLVPRRPNIDWFSTPPQVGGVSFAGGLGNQSGNQQSMNGLDLSGIQPMRQRRGLMEQAALRGIDAFDMISGVDKNAYLGKTLANEIAYEKALAEEDPEGKAADINRAKILSQRAYATDDVELKKKYGAAIKRLLPQETQGLDDLAASEFFTGGEKMEVEKLKAATQLAKQKLANEGALAKTEKQNEGKITIQDMKNEARKQHDDLDAELKLALKDKDYERAAMIRDKMTNLKAFEKEADLYRELVKQENQNYRTEYAQNAATDRTNITQGGANYRANLSADAKRYAADSAFDRTKYTQDAATDREIIKQQGALERAQAKAATISQKAVDTVSGVNSQTGEIVPSEGIIEAVGLMDKYPGLFSEMTSKFLDTVPGRVTGILSPSEIQIRERALQELQPLVKQSVQNLMQIFPKGASGIINTPKEQELFLPVADAIKSGNKNRIMGALKAYYGGMYDAAASAGEKPVISRKDYISLMMTGKTSDGRTKVSLKEAPVAQGNFVGNSKKGGKVIELDFD